MKGVQMKVRTVMTGCLLACATAYGQNREGFMQQQAYAEMQRVSGQVDVLQNNLNDLQCRMSTLESNGGTQALRQEVDALRAQVSELRSQLRTQRDEIVKELAGRLAKLPAAVPASAPREQRRAPVIGPHQEYIVHSGDTLSLIAQAAGTTVAKIKEMNGLKNDNLRIGQKLNLPR